MTLGLIFPLAITRYPCLASAHLFLSRLLLLLLLVLFISFQKMNRFICIVGVHHRLSIYPTVMSG